MGIFEIVLIAVGLSMDASAVSMTNGMCIKKAGLKHALLMATAFGIFQGIMPMIGFFAGSMFSSLFETIDHWVALILLGFIGGKMIYEALTKKDEVLSFRPLTFKLLLAQSIATSIDALAVGVSFVALDVPIFFSCLVIAIVTFIFSFFAMFIGKKCGDILSSKAELVGGLVLVIIGLKIFIEHMFFS